MSGIVGIVNLDGAPADRNLLQAMVQYMAPRGPDAQEIWIESNVGFGHTMLRTTHEAETEHQPLTIDGRTWITADCRVDAREELIRELRGQGRSVSSNAPDPELILHSYDVWGEQCVDHLLGDFSFGVWDSRKQELFCARDQFGVKPFYYARAGNAIVFSNTFNCLRFHQDLSHELDELAVADFLVYEHPLDADRSVFAAVRRLPAGHVLKVSAGKATTRKYWEPPIEDEIHYRNHSEYLEQFNALMTQAVSDRLRTRNVGVFMSGGLDSTTVAATANRIFKQSGSPFDLHAHCVVFDRIVPDQERFYSQSAANFMGIPIDFFVSDDTGFPSHEPERSWYPAEPESLLDRGRSIALHRGPAARSRVLLRGDGADPLIEMPGSSLGGVLAQRKFGRLARDLVWLAAKRRRIPRIGARSLLREKRGIANHSPSPALPSWLRPELEKKFQLRQRWLAESQRTLAKPGLELASPFWAYRLESYDLGAMQLASEMRYPFFDLRLVRFLLRMPPIPWGVEKSLLRIAMTGLLPDSILRRPKTSLVGHPWALLLPPSETKWWDTYLTGDTPLGRFVDIVGAETSLARSATKAQSRNDHGNIDELRSALSPISLNLWLQHNFNARFPSVPSTDR